MLGAVQIVPFAPLPKKSWKEGSEKKERLPIDLTSEVSEDSEEEDYLPSDSDDSDDYYDDSERQPGISEQTNDEEYFDLQAHIASLLPGELVDGNKPTKQADMTHLQDLRLVKVKRDRLKYLMYPYRVAIRWRRAERERRKHYLLKEAEERVRIYDEMQKKEIRRKMIEHQKEVLMEAHERKKRIARNSKKKVDQAQLVQKFTQDLDRRDREAKVMNFYCKNLTDWAIEGKDRQDAEAEAERVHQAELKRLAKEKAAEERRLRLIQEDADILSEDKRITEEVQSMMIRYGTVGYEAKEHETDQDKVTDIIQRAKQLKSRASMQLDLQTEERDETSTRLVLTIKKGVDTTTIKKRLNKNAHRRIQDASIGTPFKQDLSGTGSITTIKAVNIGEAGALSFAAELTRGACPMMDTLNLKNCEIRTNGMGRVIMGLKTANLLSLRVLNLRANHIGALGLEYMREVCASGLFLNLEVLNLAENELGDEGIDVLIRMIIQGHLSGLKYVDLQHNSITDIGFVKMAKVMSSLAETKCPELQRFRVENNLVTGRAKRRNAPYPHFLSC